MRKDNAGARLDRTVRLIKDLLEGKEHDAKSAAELLGIQRAAAARQLAAIEPIPGVISEKKGRRRIYRFNRAAMLTPPSPATAIAACLGASLGPLFAGTPYETAFREARDMVLRQRPTGSLPHIDRKFVFLVQGGEISLPDESGQLDELIDALLRQQWVEFDYQDFDNVVQHRRVRPLSLVVYHHRLYLMGQPEEGPLRVFRFARIKDAEATGVEFEYPSRAEYDPDQVFAASFGVFSGGDYPVQRVELRLTPRWATHVRTHRWHHSQQVKVRGDEVRISLNVRLCPELEAWVLGFGDEAEVLEPPELQERVAEKARAMARLYERTSAQPASREVQHGQPPAPGSPQAERISGGAPVRSS